MKRRVDFICHDCGCRLGRQRPRLATYHMGRCDACGELESVTQGRDYGVYEAPVAQKQEGQE